MTESKLNFEKFERFIRTTFIGLFAAEMARTKARENYKAYEFFYRSWVEVAESLGYLELATALRTSKAYRESPEQVEQWFLSVVVPVLEMERDGALRGERI